LALWHFLALLDKFGLKGLTLGLMLIFGFVFRFFQQEGRNDVLVAYISSFTFQSFDRWLISSVFTGTEKSTPCQLWRSIDALLGRGRVPPLGDIGADQFHRYFGEKVAGVRSATADFS